MNSRYFFKNAVGKILFGKLPKEFVKAKLGCLRNNKESGYPPEEDEFAEQENEMQTLAILTNGGDTCALNASIKSIRNNAYRIGYKKIYGIRRGYQGLIDDSIDDITHREIDVRIGGSCLGSLRVSPTDLCTEEEREKTGDSHKINKERSASKNTKLMCLL
jgi:hypothetical protein